MRVGAGEVVNMTADVSVSVVISEGFSICVSRNAGVSVFIVAGVCAGEIVNVRVSVGANINLTIPVVDLVAHYVNEVVGTCVRSGISVSAWLIVG